MVPLEPWEKVYIKLVGTQTSYADIDPTHAVIRCVDCHGGQEPAESHELAHSGNFINDPSVTATTTCTPCHEEIAESNVNSMHSKAWGERTTIAQRVIGADANHLDFDGLEPTLTEHFDMECATCHTTCGQCHISRPNSAGGGFISNHQFKRTPDQVNNCTACHGSRIAVDFNGDMTGRPDVHNEMNMKCLDCHQEDFHADASNVESRYHLNDLPTCEDCHIDLESSNLYHEQHYPDYGSGLACYVCHSQEYYNCNSCHTKNHDEDGDNSDWWKTDYTQGEHHINTGGGNYIEYPDFKIGYNYNQELHKGKWIVVRHIPISRDSYKNWGYPELPNYDARVTWEYTSPHNINRWTSQTDTTGTEGSCSANCHIHEGGSVNQDLYLTSDFIQENYPNEVGANTKVMIDVNDCSQCHSL